MTNELGQACMAYKVLYSMSQNSSVGAVTRLQSG